ncbi:MAG: hypothetical protein ACKOOG_00085, partial [Actinomycetota bacterium]
MTGVMDHDPDDEYDEYDDDLADDEVDGIGAGPPAVRAIDRFQHTAIGGVLAAGMLGLRDVFEPERDDQPAIVQDWSGGTMPPGESGSTRRSRQSSSRRMTTIESCGLSGSSRRRIRSPNGGAPDQSCTMAGWSSRSGSNTSRRP